MAHTVPSAQILSKGHSTHLSILPNDHMNPGYVSRPSHKTGSHLDMPHPADALRDMWVFPQDAPRKHGAGVLPGGGTLEVHGGVFLGQKVWRGI